MRKRRANNDLPEVARPSGKLNDDELARIHQAYRDGCKGEILIGLCGEERVMTMFLPAQASPEAAASLMMRSRGRLKEMGCDLYIRVRSKAGL